MITELLARTDGRLGEVIEHASRRHHVRRLSRLGWDRAFRARSGWGSGAPVRDGNLVDVHIDGTSALPAIVAAVRSARSFVHVAGWTVNPDFAVERTPEVVTLRALLAEAADRVDVRVLVWAGAPVPVMHPTRAEAKQLMDRLVRGTRIRGALDRRNRPMHCHHEKLIIVDGTVAFVGGIDLTDLAGDRYDGPPHSKAAQLGWHDAAASLAGPGRRGRRCALRDAVACDDRRVTARADRPRPGGADAACRWSAPFRSRPTRICRGATSASSRRTWARCGARSG